MAVAPMYVHGLGQQLKLSVSSVIAGPSAIEQRGACLQAMRGMCSPDPNVEQGELFEATLVCALSHPPPP